MLIAGEDNESSDEEFVEGVFMDEHDEDNYMDFTDSDSEDEDAGALIDPDYDPAADEQFHAGGSSTSTSNT